MTQQDFDDLLDTIRQTNSENENLKLQQMEMAKSYEELKD
jgi:hypothetical protein